MKRTSLFLLIPLLVTACGDTEEAPSSVVRPALTVVVGAQAADRGNVYSGEVHARYETDLGFRIGGKIVERLVDIGAQVKKGQLLARLDAADTGLKKSAADAQYRLADEELKRYRELRAKGLISQSALDAKETALKAAAAEVGLARNQAAYTSLQADRDGVISAAYAEVGQVVAAGQPVVRIAQHGEREVSIAIPESRYDSVKVDMPAEIELLSANNGTQILPGHVREISPAADAVSRTYPARVAFDSGDTNMALGMTARVRLSDAGEQEGYLIPLTALFQQGEHAAVWIVAQDGRVSLRPVTVTTYLDEGALIGSGINAGERIVSAGVHKLSEGEKVRPVDAGNAQ